MAAGAGRSLRGPRDLRAFEPYLRIRREDGGILYDGFSRHPVCDTKWMLSFRSPM